MNDKERLEEMEVLINEYYDNIDDPFATTDIAIEIIEKTVWLIKQNKKQTEQVGVLLGENENHFRNIKSMERRIKKLEKEIETLKFNLDTTLRHNREFRSENLLFREVIEQTLNHMGLVDRQKYGEKLERALEGEE